MKLLNKIKGLTLTYIHVNMLAWKVSTYTYMDQKKKRMNLYCIKCLKVKNNNNIEIKHEIDGSINLCSDFIDCVFKILQILVKKN